jgi:blue copper oxidase
MKISTLFIGLFIASITSAQNKLTIPTTLSGSEINLAIKPDSVQFLPGTITQTLAYNGRYLGPTLILDNGNNVSINVTNELGNGDTTTTHWHGLHIAPENDGGPHSLILDGATWNPQFTVMDKASMYWYHPHLHSKTGEQVMKGAAGLIIVRDADEAKLALPRDYGVNDFPLVVQTQEFDANNQIIVDGMRDSIGMVNGTIDPMVDMPAQIVRMRLLNADQERNYNFGLTGNKSFSIIGSDGGLLDAPVSQTRVRLAPGERVEILVDLSGMESQMIHLMSYASEIPMGTQGGPTMKMPNGMPMAMMDSPLNGVDYTILQIDVVAALTNPIITIPSVLVTNGQNDLPQIADVKKTRVIKFTPVKNPTPMQAMDGPFLFNDSTFDMTRIDQDVTLNDVEIWELRNMTMVAHPFHIHDVQFFILDDDGKLPSPEKSGRKDVVSVGPKDTVRFITVFKDFSGTTPYMFHCHNLMHEDGGMMGQFTVTSDLGINETHAISDVSVFPNPSNGILTIQNYGSAHLNVRITNSMGQELIQVEELSNLNNSIDLSGFANGTYLVSITDGINKQTKKVIIQH